MPAKPPAKKSRASSPRAGSQAKSKPKSTVGVKTKTAKTRVKKEPARGQKAASKVTKLKSKGEQQGAVQANLKKEPHAANSGGDGGGDVDSDIDWPPVDPTTAVESTNVFLDERAAEDEARRISQGQTLDSATGSIAGGRGHKHGRGRGR